MMNKYSCQKALVFYGQVSFQDNILIPVLLDLYKKLQDAFAHSIVLNIL